MSTPCKIERNNVEVELQNQEDREEFFDTNSAVRKYKNEAADILNILEEEYSKGQFINCCFWQIIVLYIEIILANSYQPRKTNEL